MKVSVIVPCYKVEKYLPTCIESVINQSYTQWELILIDDGSPDKSGKICDEYAKKDSRIRVIHKPNGGLSSARNAGLDIITGEFISFLDSDDFWHPDYLKILMKFIVKENAEIVQCSFVRGIETSFPKLTKPTKVTYYDNHSIFTKQAAKIIMWGKIYKASFFDDIRMPIGLINEDDWTTWKLYYKAKKIVVTNQALYYYTQNPNSIMGDKKRKIDLSYFGAYKERIDFFKEKKEKDLEDISRIQFCKSLFLLYLKPLLTLDEQLIILKTFRENWNAVKYSSFIGNKYKILFRTFSSFPYVIRLFAQLIK